jgi:Tol biopolymer transport system component
LSRLAVPISALTLVSLVAGAGSTSAGGAGARTIVFSTVRDSDLGGEIYSVSLDGSGRRNLSRSTAKEYAHAVSPDGRHVAFISERGGKPALWLADVRGGSMRRLTDGFRFEGVAGGVAWSPDGRHILYTRAPGAADDSRSELWVVPTEGGRSVRLARDGWPAEWSPSGERIAYTDYRNDRLRAVVALPNGRELWSRRGAFESWSPRGDRAALLIYGEESVSTVITTAAGRPLARFRGQALAWAPDGRRLLVARPAASTAQWIGLVRADGRVVRQIGDFWFGGGFSADGDAIGFAGLRDGRTGVFVLTRSGSLRRRIRADADFATWATARGRTVLVAGTRRGLTAYSPPRYRARPLVRLLPGSQYVYGVEPTRRGRLVYGRDATSSSDLWVMRPNGTGLRPLWRDVAHDAEPAWSPDGRWIAFTRRDNCSVCATFLFTAGADGSDRRGLTAPPANQQAVASPTWSPDGRQIAFAVSGRRVRGAIYVIDVEAGAQARGVIGHEAQAGAEEPAYSAPDWSPDGSELVFVATGGDGGLFAAHTDGSHLRRIVSGRASAPQWSPDGHSVAFRRADGIYVVPSGGGVALKLTHACDLDQSLAWSPDGRSLMFADCVRGRRGQEMFTVRADGTRRQRITRDRFVDSSPAWRPLAER